MAGGPGVTPISAGRLHVDGDHGAKQVSLSHTAAAVADGAAGIPVCSHLGCIPTD
jgi:Rieske Fe-S protein